MADISTVSDEELLATLSDDDLKKLAGIGNNNQNPNRLPLLKDQPVESYKGNPILNGISDTSATIINNLADVGDQTLNTLNQVKEHPFKSAGAVIGSVANTIAHPIASAKSTAQDLIDKVKNAPDKPVDALLSLGSAGLMAEGGIALAKNPKPILDILKGTSDNTKNIISNVRDYAANKTNSIRNGFWNEYAPKEWKAYGDAIESLPTQGGGKIDGASYIQNLNNTLTKKGLMDAQGNILQATNPADAKLLKQYDILSKKWADSTDGKIDIKDVVDGYKNIKGEFTYKTNASKRDCIQSANDLFNAAESQINNDAFNVAKARYSGFKQNQEMIDKKVGLYGPSMDTLKGEKFLMEGGLSGSTTGRKVGKMITETTGQTLKAAKLSSAIKNIPILEKLIKR